MDKILTQATVLIVPGLRDYVAEHWQTHLEARLEKVRSVPPLQIDKLNCAKRVDAIQAELDQITGPVILVAHSAGVLMTVHWAAKYQPQDQCQIKGALLVTPPDLHQSWPDNYPSPDVLRQEGWDPIPTEKLPFPTIVIGSTNDHLATLDAVTEMADVWGAEFINLGEVGHLNPVSGYGPWPQAEAFIRQLDKI